MLRRVGLGALVWALCLPPLAAALWPDLRVLGGSAALLALMLVVAGAYLRRYEPALWADMRLLGVMASLVVAMAFITETAALIFPHATPYVMPIPLAAMLATQLCGPRVGLLVTMLTTALGLLLVFASPIQGVGAFAASVSAVVVFSALSERAKLVRAGLWVMVASGSAAALAALASGDVAAGIGVAGVQGVLGGAAASVLAFGLLPFLEQLFGVTTDVRLLELTSPTAPLMRELMRDAPGTYAHSVEVGNLAETAAEAIGANPLLARTGAYYHDIGKLRRPSFFAENQGEDVNPHDDTSPSMSAMIITAHVQEGVAAARERGLPEEVVAIIREHHGDSLVSYFYNKAAAGEEPVYEADFRYAGERPRSREAALVMLADSAEAAVRAVPHLTAQQVEATVRRVVDERVADGQLRDSDLTLADIERVVSAFSRILSRVHHKRIEYPEQRRADAPSERHEPSRS